MHVSLASACLAVVAVTLEHLDLVAVRILDKEVPCEQSAGAVLELLDVSWRAAELREPLALACHVIDADGEMAVAVAMRIRFLPVLVNRELDFEVVLPVPKIHQRKRREVETMHLLETEGIAIETQRPFEVEHADHGVDKLGHLRAPSMQASLQI